MIHRLISTRDPLGWVKNLPECPIKAADVMNFSMLCSVKQWRFDVVKKFKVNWGWRLLTQVTHICINKLDHHWFRWRKCIWRCHLKNGVHFVSVSFVKSLLVTFKENSSAFALFFEAIESHLYLHDKAFCRKMPGCVFDTYPSSILIRQIYCLTSNIRHTKSQNLSVSRLVLQLSLPNPLKPGVRSRMKM